MGARNLWPPPQPRWLHIEQRSVNIIVCIQTALLSPPTYHICLTDAAYLAADDQHTSSDTSTITIKVFVLMVKENLICKQNLPIMKCRSICYCPLSNLCYVKCWSM